MRRRRRPKAGLQSPPVIHEVAGGIGYMHRLHLAAVGEVLEGAAFAEAVLDSDSAELTGDSRVRHSIRYGARKAACDKVVFGRRHSRNP